VSAIAYALNGSEYDWKIQRIDKRRNEANTCVVNGYGVTKNLEQYQLAHAVLDEDFRKQMFSVNEIQCGSGNKSPMKGIGIVDGINGAKKNRHT
jgi:hypothetical protein